MNEYRSILERAGSQFHPPDLPLERIERGRDRRRRNERIRAGAVGLAIAIGVAWLGANVVRSTPSVPADETGPPAPSPEGERPPGGIDWERVPGVSIDGDAIVDIGTGEVTPLPESITSFRDSRGYAVAPSGDVLLFHASARGSSDNTCGAGTYPNPGCQIFVASVDGRNLRQLTDAPGGAAAGGWSPEGTKIVALVGGPAGRRFVDLVMVDVATGETMQLASGPGIDFYEPHFSPDGRRILFGRFTKPMGSDTFGIPVDGGNAALVFEERWNAIFSPDGRTIVYDVSVSVGNLGGPELWLADADGSHPRRLVPTDEPFSDSQSWSPDGTRIVYTKLRRDADALVAVVDVASGIPTFSVLAPETPVGVWLDDDTLLVDVGAYG